MIDPSWQYERQGPEPDAVDTPAPNLVSLHFLRSALRRRWKLITAFAIVGLLLGFVFNQAIPAKSSASVTLLLAHDPGTDPTRAMATDVSLLDTRAVASQALNQLGLTMNPQDFLNSVTAHAVTDQVLTLRVTAPNGPAAVARAQALANQFLTFRAATNQKQSDVLVTGYTNQIDALNAQVADLTKRYNSLIGQPGVAGGQAQDALTLRSQLSNEITSLQQTIEDTTLRTSYVQSTSHVLDAATADPAGVKKRFVLDLVSGLIGGLAVGIGLVLFLALTSERLRRREDVATALGTPVRITVGKLRRGGRVRRLLIPRAPRGKNFEVLLHGLEKDLRPNGPIRVRVALASIDTARDCETSAAALAARLHARGLAVFVVDLSETGHVTKSVARALHHVTANGSTPEPEVFRPEGVPTLAQGPLGLPFGAASDLPEADPRRVAFDKADVVLTVAEVDPAIGADHLTSWADDVVLITTAGASSAERLRSTAELIRVAGLNLRFAVMIGADANDESLGFPDAGEGSSNGGVSGNPR